MNLLPTLFILYLRVCLISCESHCNKQKTCGTCIRSYEKDDICVWCSAKDHIGPRCHSKSTLVKTWCSKPVYDPVYVKAEKNSPLNDGSGGTQQIVQFMPQDMIIKTRAHVPIKFTMSYKPARNYPLDVYYIIDLSYTMKGLKTKLRDQASRIQTELSKITNDVRLGVGSFIEKPGLPFVDTENYKSAQYSFKNHQSLTNEKNLFKNAFDLLINTDGRSNEIPDATLDALMEAMVCNETIGWRNNSHRIILISTDSPFHSSGDGKFVGAIQPHDMQCHLTNNEYKETSLMYDYPSVSQINKIASDKNIMIIFAAANYVQDYKILVNKIKNAKYVPLRLNDSNVVDMITEQYNEMCRNAQIDATIHPSVSLTFEPNCTVKGVCSSKSDKPFNIHGTLTIDSCPATTKNYDVKIGPVMIDEKLTIHIEANCQCDCENEAQDDSDLCSKNGTYKCGICQCNKNRYGDNCECIGSKKENDCKGNEIDSIFCSNRGNCSCGKCVCQNGFTGDFCEIDNDSCKRPGGVLCSGHGNCVNNVCHCYSGWRPDDCLCPVSNEVCKASHSDEECSGQGDCVCGQCVCNRTKSNNLCTGVFCEICVESSPERCAELTDYAYCNFKQNKDCDEKFNITDSEVHLVNKTMMYLDNVWHTAKLWCTIELDDGQKLKFRYNFPKSTNSTLLLIIQETLDVQPVDNVWVVACSVIGAVLLIGILTLIAWKLLVDLHDKREYEKFRKSSEDPNYSTTTNVLYVKPENQYQNPAYNPDDCQQTNLPTRG